MKDPVTRQIKTVSVRVEGPISLVETSTAMKELDHENLNRCFIIAIEPSHKLTREPSVVGTFMISYLKR